MCYYVLIAHDCNRWRFSYETPAGYPVGLFEAGKLLNFYRRLGRTVRTLNVGGGAS